VFNGYFKSKRSQKVYGATFCTEWKSALTNGLRLKAYNSTTSEMPEKFRAKTQLCEVISTVERKFAKTQAFDWLRYFHFATE
jgi:hypothetical protein